MGHTVDRMLHHRFSPHAPCADIRRLSGGLGLKLGDRANPTISALQRVLARYGLLSSSGLDGSFDLRTECALLRFQNFYGLPASACFDLPTLRAMARSRHDDWPDSQGHDDSQFISLRYRWLKGIVSFHFDFDLEDDDVQSAQSRIRAAMRLAFTNWEAGSALRFREVSHAADGDIRIGCGFLDGPSGTLANTALTCRGLEIARAAIDFDQLETWAAFDRSVMGADEFLSSAMHAIGHLIGLDHSNDPRAVMYAYFNPARQTLAQADIDQVARIYGARPRAASAGAKVITRMCAATLPLTDGCTGTLNETAHFGPSAASLDGRVFIAWSGTDREHCLNVIQLKIDAAASSIDWVRKVTLPETSRAGVSLAAFRDRLVMFWPSRGTCRLNMLSSSDGVSWTDKLTLDNACVGRPSLTVHEDRLIVVFTDRHDGLAMMSTSDLIDWKKTRLLPEANVADAAVTSFRGQLVLCWVEEDDEQRRLWLTISDDMGASWQKPIVLPPRGVEGVSLIEQNGELLVAWNDAAARHRLHTMRSADGVYFGAKQSLPGYSAHAPSLVAAGASSVLVWTADGPLNIKVRLLIDSAEPETDLRLEICRTDYLGVLGFRASS